MNENFPTYKDLKYSKTSKIFEAEEIKDLTPEQISESEKAFKLLLEKLEKGEEIDEGFLSGLVGAGVGALVGPVVMKAVAKSLGIQEGGALYNLLTSKLVLASVGYSLGK
jgi:hypothetical protein